MSPDLDRESAAAVEALVFRLRNREPGTDDEPFALEFITALRGRGWRPIEALTPWDFRKLPSGDGPPASEETRRQLEEARSAAAAALARQRAAERPGAA